ncbi:HAMP domain-containing sensor histidine kinase, partial [Autumnicola musiva]
MNLSSKGDQAIFKVHNEGTPIPEDIRNKIFNDRFTSNNAGTTTEKNYGLGLYDVKEIVERHQGKIELNSTGDEGTTFK